MLDIILLNFYIILINKYLIIMVKWFKNLFNHECKHEWIIEDPLFSLSGGIEVQESPIYERCKKCGERRRRPDCRHLWFLAPDTDEINGVVVNGKKIEKTAICGKCGLSKYEVFDLWHLIFIFQLELVNKYHSLISLYIFYHLFLLKYRFIPYFFTF